MAKNILVVSCDVRETRAALIEDGIIAELHIERKGAAASTVGNVYLGKVTRVLPGLQAAFIDIGQERAAFLHVEDLIRPDDFDAYLAGGRKHAREETAVVEDAADVDEAAPVEPAPVTALSAEPALAEPLPDDLESIDDLSPSPLLAELASQVDLPADQASASALADEAGASSPDIDSSDEDDEPIEEDEIEEPVEVDEPAEVDEPTENEESEEPTEEDEAKVDAGQEDSEAAAEPPPSLAPTFDIHSRPTLQTAQGAPPASPSGRRRPPPVSVVGADPDDDLDFPDDLPGFTVSDPGEPVPRAPAPARASDKDRGRGGGRRRRGRGRPGERPERATERPASPERQGGGSGGGERHKPRGRSPGNTNGPVPNRISKSTPIREVVREGQEIIVQVTKDPIGTKGARCSSHISLPGRYVVYLPTVEHVGISKRIGSEKERSRLRDAIDGMKPPSGGLIVRTVAEGLTKKQLKQDVGYLVRLWGEIAKKKEVAARAPNLLMSELDLVLKVARDLFTDEVSQLVVDDRVQYDRLCRFIEMFAPERLKDVILYNDEEPIFDAYGIEDEIGRALSRKVPLPSGGHLVIDQAEALTAIDVNTGRFVGKGSKDMEETILKTNLEAVNEIAYQLRFRNIGGLIILDLIDMERASNREKVRRTLEELLQKDKAKTTLNRISELGLIEMTRKRTRESLGRMLHEPCFYCDGTGQLMSKETIAYEILREIRRKKADLPGYSVVINAHPAVADVLNGTEKEAVQETENRFMRKIVVVPRKEYHLEQFDIVGK